MGLSFPATPSVGQNFQNWTWDGEKWGPNPAAQVVTSFNGRTGPVTLQQSDILGNRIPIMSQVISSATLFCDFIYDFTNLYDLYEVDIYNYSPTADAALACYYLTANGWEISTNAYAFAYTSGSANGSGSAGGTTINFLYIMGTQISNAAPNVPASTRLVFPMLWTNDRYKPVLAQWTCYNPSTGGTTGLNAAYWGGNLPVKGLRFQPQAGQIARLVANLYGIAKSGVTP